MNSKWENSRFIKQKYTHKRGVWANSERGRGCLDFDLLFLEPGPGSMVLTYPCLLPVGGKLGFLLFLPYMVFLELSWHPVADGSCSICSANEITKILYLAKDGV